MWCLGLSKKNLLYSIFFVILQCSSGRSSPSFQLLVMNPGFLCLFAKVVNFLYDNSALLDLFVMSTSLAW